MGSKTEITWAGATWNPWQGCHKVSSGCLNCYMYRDKKRFGQDPTKVVRSKPRTFNAPLKWKEPRTIFVCSWSDFFLEEADEWRKEAYAVMDAAPQHTYLILTKRPNRMVSVGWDRGQNRWLGVTTENQEAYDQRMPRLARMNVARTFLSVEPMIGPVKMRWPIDWVICAGESGTGCRPMELEWARELRDQCRRAGVPFHMKQLGGYPDKRCELEDLPEDLRIREFPWGVSQ